MSSASREVSSSLANAAGEIHDGNRNVLRLPPIEAHDLWAATYDETPNPLLALEERTLGPMLPNLEGAFVLDVACGTGRWLEKLVRRGARRVIGLDLSSQMLLQAARKPTLQHHLIRADCSAIPLRSRTVDVAICSFAVSYVTPLDLFARELARVLTVGGALFLSDFHPSGYARGWKRCFRQGRRVIEIASSSYSIPCISKVFVTAGFKQVFENQLSFGEEEKRIFQALGKEKLFAQLRDKPAIFNCSFALTEHAVA